MDELDYSSFLTNNNLGHALGGASDASLFVSPDQLNVSYGDFSLGLDDHSPPSGATGWESTPESALLSSFNTPLNINEQLAGQSVDWSNTPLFQTLSTDTDFTAPVASRSSSSGSLPSGAVNPDGVSGHRRTPSSARRLIERSAAVSKRRKTREVSPIDLESLKAAGDKKEYKKKKNTEAARKSRAAKAERIQAIEGELLRMEEESLEKDAEIERLKRLLSAHGINSA